MGIDFFSKQELDDLITELKKDINGNDSSIVPIENIHQAHNKLLDILRISLKNAQWTFEQFLSLALGFQVIESLKSGRHIANNQDAYFQNKVHEWNLYFLESKKWVDLNEIEGKSVVIVGNAYDATREFYFVENNQYIMEQMNYRRLIPLTKEEQLPPISNEKLIRTPENTAILDGIMINALTSDRIIPKINDIRPLIIFDINEAAIIVNNDFQTLQSFIQEKCPHQSISTPETPIIWLSLLKQSNFQANAIFSKLIQYTHHGLDENIADHGIFPVHNRKTLKEVAKELGTNEDNLLSECFRNNFGIYLKEEDLKITRMITHSSDDYVVNNNIDHTYPYYYKGHVRLKKISPSNPEGTVEHFYRANTVEYMNDKSINLIELQPSIAEVCAGIRSYIELKPGQKIIRDDLIIFMDELSCLKETNLSKNKIGSASFTSREQLEQVASLNINEPELKNTSMPDGDSISEDIQFLTRKAIKKNYVRSSGIPEKGKMNLAGKAINWDSLFEKEKTNGLTAARIIKKRQNRAIYNRQKLHNWLISEGYFSQKELYLIEHPLNPLESAALSLADNN